MPWHKITFSSSVVSSGRSVQIIITFSEILQNLSYVNRDDILIYSENNPDDSVTYYFSPEVGKHLFYELLFFDSIPCNPPDIDTDQNSSELRNLLGIPDLIKTHNFAYIMY